MEAILATDSKHGIARQGVIPWHSKTDIAFFKAKTMNHIVIMGSKTFDTLKRPLLNRLNIVLTKSPETRSSLYDNVIFTDDDEIYKKYLGQGKTIFIIGGKQLYEKYMPMCEIIWHTIVKKDYDCDLFTDVTKLIEGCQTEAIFEDELIHICKLTNKQVPYIL